MSARWNVATQRPSGICAWLIAGCMACAIGCGAPTSEGGAPVEHGALEGGSEPGTPASAEGGNTSALPSVGTVQDAAATIDDSSVSSGDPASDGGAPCTVTSTDAICHTQPVVTITNGSDTRQIYWAEPLGDAPAGGRPGVILYQGTGFGPSTSWDVSLGVATPFGGYYQVAVVASLIDAGFVVVQPEAQGGLAWDTNNGSDYDTSADAVFIPQLLADVAQGTFGAVDMTHLYATGISSGGYMTSRMAVSYPGRFRALAIESGSYATCAGPICNIPATLPSDHPPTLFLHGGADDIVPIATAQAYYQELMAQGIDTKFVEDPSAGHQWLSTAPQDVTQWFTTH